MEIERDAILFCSEVNRAGYPETDEPIAGE